ncbi:MAG: cyclic nucleotide-binding domain-containing protein [Opitutales bacterium]|nr:cyclic nucleotide-binding domain-containing protein [Opitutales bacterium]MCH8539660.1 cyclic nucleotide-binding domain-containing protein [Opitutales bacterium]
MALSEKSSPFLATLGDALCERFLSEAKKCQGEKSDVLFFEGESSASVILITKGKIQLEKETPAEESSLVLAVRASGSLLGELGVLDGQPRSATARVAENAEWFELSAENFLQLMEKAPLPSWQFLFQQVSRNLRETNDSFRQTVVHREKMSMVGEMAGRIIHDFRNPFTHIRLIGEILGSQHSDETTQRMVKNLDLQIEKMEGMSTELLEFSKGQPSLEKEPVAVEDILYQMDEENKPVLEKKKIRWTSEGEEGTLTIDRVKIVRSLQNLINNAADALEKQPDATISLKIKHSPGDKEWVFTVADNGPGIPAELKEQIFEPFVTHGKKNGTGIGLAIVKNLIEAHGGTIQCQSESGQGTYFTIALPSE